MAYICISVSIISAKEIVIDSTTYKNANHKTGTRPTFLKFFVQHFDEYLKYIVTNQKILFLVYEI